jgi:LuxR family maltose regulon positive regulatory protein
VGKTDSYLNHAIMPPSLKPIHAPRPRLVNDLNRKLDKKLILISAAAGFGKTTLLAEFTAQADRPVSWVRLTDADQDVMRLAEILWSSLVRRFRRLRNAVRIGGLAGASPSSLARVIVGAVADRVDEPFVVIFDDAHRLNVADECKAFLASFISDAPPGMTILAAGRELLDVPLVQLLAADKLATFDSDSLTLRADELADVVARRTGESVSEAMVGDLMEETGGWVTGVLLSERLVSHQVPSLISADEPLAYEYLATAVFDRQPEAVQRFLLDSSVLPVMTADLCDAVLEREDSGEMLEDMLARGLFISVTDDQPTTYEYHHLFRGFLGARARLADSDAFRTLQVRAARRLALLDEWKELSAEMFMALDEPIEARKVAVEVTERMFLSGRRGTLLRWSDYFHRKRVPVPSLNTLLASLMEAFGQRSDVIPMLDRATSMASKLEDADSRLLKRRRATTMGFIAFAKEDWKTLREVIRDLKKLHARDSDVNGLRSLYRLEAFYAADYLGDRSAATRLIRSATDLGSPSASPLDAALAWTSRSYIECYGGDLLSAEISAEKALSMFKSHGILYGEYVALMDLAYVRHLLGKYETAMPALEQAKKSARTLGSRSARDLVSMTELEMISELGRLQEATQRVGTLTMRILEREERLSLKKYAVALEASLLRRRGDLSGAAHALSQGGELGNADRHSRLVAERLGLFSMMATNDLLLKVRRARNEVPFTEQDGTLAVYFLSRWFFALGQSRRAVWWATAALNRALKGGGIQVLAAELNVDEDFRRFLHLNLKDGPQWNTLAERLAKMTSVGSALHTEVFSQSRATRGISIRALGTVEVTLDERPVTSLGPQELRLLILLADKGTLRSEALADVFWPGIEPGRQMSSLHTSVHRLRAGLGRSVVRYSHNRYTIAEEAIDGFDVSQFLEGLKQATLLSRSEVGWQQVARETLDLYQGPFMDGEEGGWILERRAELEISYLDFVARFAGGIQTRKSAMNAIPYVRNALRTDPYREDINQIYLDLLALLGRPVARVQHLRRYRRILKEDLGIEASNLDEHGSI